MAIESKNLLVWVKAMSRGQALPLDASEIYSTLAEAENYASTSAIAYAGQTVKAKTEDGKYHSYTLQPSEAGYVLEEIGAVNESDLKQYVMVVDALPESGQVVLTAHTVNGTEFTSGNSHTVSGNVSVVSTATLKPSTNLTSPIIWITEARNGSKWVYYPLAEIWDGTQWKPYQPEVQTSGST
jgi:hypothetical protein